MGEYHACFVLSDGDVKCLFNADGDSSVYFAQDGGGGTLTFDSPAVEIDAGYFHTCVLLESGAVSCWGRAGSGQIGDELPNSGPEITRFRTPWTSGPG